MRSVVIAAMLAGGYMLSAIGPAAPVNGQFIYRLPSAPADTSNLCDDAATAGTIQYMNASASGGGTGDSWANAWTTLSEAESEAARGRVVCVADGTYEGATMNTATSGTTTITFAKATATDHGSDTGWVSTMGDGQALFTSGITFDSPYWVFDGKTGGGPGNWEGTSPAFGFRVEQTGGGPTKVFRFNSVSNITIQHVDVENSGEDTAGNADNFYVIGASAITVRYVWTHDTNRTNFLLDGSTGLTLEYSLVSERHSTDGTHGEHMSINNSGLGAGTIIRWNIFRNSTNTGTIVIKDSIQSGFEIYGNLFYQTDPVRYWNGNGVITDTTGDSTTSVKMFNNTFLPYVNGDGNPTAVTSWDVSTGNEFTNNLVVGPNPIEGATALSNLCFALTGAECGTSSQIYGGTEASLFTDPTTRDYTLKIATDAGTTLASPYNVDMNGNMRGADGIWDRGAFEFMESLPLPEVVQAWAGVLMGAFH